MDPLATLLLSGVMSLLTGAVAGGVIGEWRARAAEKRAEAREANRARRDHLLRQIDDTVRDYVATTDYLFARVMGVEHTAAPTGQAAYPNAQWYLIGDEELLRQVYDLRHELMDRPPGSLLTVDDVARMGAQRGHVLARLDAQRDRIIRGLEPIWPSRGFVQQVLGRAQERYGIPPDYQPPLRQDLP